MNTTIGTTRTIVEIHAIETTSAANLNRDDTDAPKTMIYGGTLRARVSSQCWKRAVRESMAVGLNFDDTAVRTKRVVAHLAEAILSIEPSLDREQAMELADQTMSLALKIANNESGYLTFIGNGAYRRLAELAIKEKDKSDTGKAIETRKKDIRAIVKDDHSIEVHLFGRMVADDTDLNVDACVQVAHAFSIHTIEPDSDFYTAVDDVKANTEGETDAGAGMIGNVDFNTATWYRVANIDVDRLNDAIHDRQSVAHAVAEFVRAFITSVPQAKVHAFAQAPLPDAVYVTIRDTHAVNLDGAFRKPVTPDYVEHGVEAMADRELLLENAYGVKPVNAWTIQGDDQAAAISRLAEPTTMTNMLAQLETTVADRLKA